MKILILGSTGMLGNSVAKHFLEETRHDIFLTHRTDDIKLVHNSIKYDPTVDDFEVIKGFDYIINCIGIIKPFINKNIQNSIFINSLYPHKLADFCKNNNSKLIHITTDCVFSGKDGKYSEESTHDCLDIYGKTKSLGEPNNCMVIRTSIIGDEIHNNASLIAWVKSNKNGKINGFTNHLWNGITTEQYGKICSQIINDNMYSDGLYHVHSNTVSKFELLQLINKYYNLNISINQVESSEFIDRTMISIKELNKKLDIPSLEEQIKSIASKFSNDDQIVS